MRAAVKRKVETDSAFITSAPQTDRINTPFLPHFRVSAYIPNHLRLISLPIYMVPLDLMLTRFNVLSGIPFSTQSESLAFLKELQSAPSLVLTSHVTRQEKERKD